MSMIQEETIQALVNAVISDSDGYSAWTNFLGYAPDEDSDTELEVQIGDVAYQMPEEELCRYLDCYGIEY